MFLRINSVLPLGDKYKAFAIFGYRSNSVPGLDVKGLPKNQSIVREKLIYFSKMNYVKFPMRKFHLCIDLPKEFNGIKKENLDESLLELPLLLLYWSLAGVLDFHELQYCFCQGRLLTDGKIEIPELPQGFMHDFSNEFSKLMHRRATFIVSKLNAEHDAQQIKVSEILELGDYKR